MLSEWLEQVKEEVYEPDQEVPLAYIASRLTSGGGCAPSSLEPRFGAGTSTPWRSSNALLAPQACDEVGPYGPRGA